MDFRFDISTVSYIVIQRKDRVHSANTGVDTSLPRPLCITLSKELIKCTTLTSLIRNQNICHTSSTS